MGESENTDKASLVLVLSPGGPIFEAMTRVEGVAARACEGLPDLLQGLREDVVDLIVVESTSLDLLNLVPIVRSVDHDAPLVIGAQVEPEVQAELLQYANTWIVHPRAMTDAAIETLVLRGQESRRLRARLARIHSWMHASENWTLSAKKGMREMFHDLKTPIAILDGYCSNLVDELDGPLTEEQKKSLSRMRNAIETVRALVVEPRAFIPDLPAHAEQELTHDARAPARRQLRIPQVAREVVEMFQAQARQKGVHVSYREDGPIPPVWGERSRLSQLIVNLVANALRHTGAGDRIDVSLRRVEAEAGRASHVVLAVADTGAGIPEARQAQLFERGFSPDGRTGLGLGICREIIQEHGAELDLESEEGVGSTFSAKLPVDPRARRQSAQLRILGDDLLLGQLVTELVQRAPNRLNVVRSTDVEALAEEIIRKAGAVVVGGGDAPGVARALAELEGKGGSK